MGTDPVHAFCDYTSGDRGLVSDLVCLQADASSVDVILLAGPARVRFPAHSAILGARCSSLVPDIKRILDLRRIERGGLQGSSAIEVALPRIAPRTMVVLLRYVYTGHIRLNSSNVFRLMLAAEELGMPRLLNLVSHHIHGTTDLPHALNYLVQSLELELHLPAIYTLKFISHNTKDVLARDEFYSLPPEAVSLIVKQECLSASESEIWHALVRWACLRASIPVRASVSETSEEEKCQLCEHLREYLRPGFIRILNLDTVSFAAEVEPLNLLSDEEVLLKYRFDATADLLPFEDAFPLPRSEFLSRVRQQIAFYQSPYHPHPRGITEKVMVVMPSWTRQIHIDFDQRCRLGRYAELSFYTDEDCSAKVASLNSVFASYRVNLRRPAKNPQVPISPRLSIPVRRFWFTFYAPGNFAPSWGYAFRVTPSIV
jgi:BTB/POZ domain/BTB And C-terminal Kelch